MIWFVYGTPRTGKSLFGGLVDAIIPALKRGRKVYTNIPLIRLGICRECKITVMDYNRLVHSITCIQDIFVIYDSEQQQIKREFLDSVFVLDEFRALRGLTKQTEEFLTKILNVVSKSAVDFYMIAQLPKYFDDETRDLGEGCCVFERGDKMGKRNSSIMYSFDQKAGTPCRIGNKWDTDFWEYRYREPKYFNMYHSYSLESEELMKERGEDHNYLPFWKKKTFKVAIICFSILIVIFVILGLLFKNTSDTLNAFTKSGQKKEQTKEKTLNFQSVPKKIQSNDDIDEKLCYTQIWINDNTVTYKLNNGNYAYNPSYLIERCSRSFVRKYDKNL